MENCIEMGKLTEKLFSDYCAQLWHMTLCIINASNRRESANCSIKSFLYRTTFGNDHLQLAENTENDQKFASSKRKYDRPSPWKTVNMRRNKMKKIALFSILAIKKSNREVVSEAGESAFFQIRSADWDMVPKSGESRFMGESWQVCCTYTTINSETSERRSSKNRVRKFPIFVLYYYIK